MISFDFVSVKFGRLSFLQFFSLPHFAEGKKISKESGLEKIKMDMLRSKIKLR